MRSKGYIVFFLIRGDSWGAEGNVRRSFASPLPAPAYELAYHPDGNGDRMIGVPDLLRLLSVFGEMDSDGLCGAHWIDCP